MKRKSRISLELIWIDQAPARNRLIGECERGMAQLEEARKRWHHFERKDRPAFIRWRAREFGALLSEARRVEEGIRETREWIDQVEAELRRTFQSPQSAYARVKFRREHPGQREPAAEMGGGEKRPLTEFEQEALFQEWVRKFLGTNPDKMDDRSYESNFAAFKQHMFSRQAEVQADVANHRRAQQPKPPPEEEQEEPARVDERLKSLYRRLARELHPDARADGSTQVSTLWHEVQEAYAAGDVARMELLLALSHLRAGSLALQASYGELVSLRDELARSVWTLRESLREAENEEAWNFAAVGSTPNLVKEVEGQLKHDLRNRRKYLQELEGVLGDWRNGVD